MFIRSTNISSVPAKYSHTATQASFAEAITTERIISNAETAIEEIAEPKTKRGDLWILGAHRLLCGDCTQKEDVAKVLEDKYADVMVTDPPYNVDYGGTINGKDRNIANDNLSEDELKLLSESP